MTDAGLRLSGVGCGRAGRPLLTGVNIALGAGDALHLHGPNGIGKSTLLRLCAGLLRPWAGTVERQGRVALADERPALDPALSLGRALAFWARIDGAPPGAADRALAAMALDALADVPVHMLSTGQRRRATIARTILSGAPIWLLDEPANGLDDASAALLGTAIAAHRADGGMALIASHQPLSLIGAAQLDLRAHRVSAP